MISNFNKKILLTEKLSQIEKHISTESIPALIELDIDPIEFQGSEDDLLNLIEEIEKHNIGHDLSHPNRFNRSFQLWRSKNIDKDHYMSATCLASDISMKTPISEDYGDNSFKLIMDKYGFGRHVDEHAELINVNGCFAITYSHTSMAEIFPQVRDVHPYYIAHTLHELLKLMMEWEWCYLNLESKEPMAEISHLALSNLGLSLEKINKSAAVKSIWELPDMQVANYLKNEEYTPTPVDPPEPLDFKLWVSKNLIFRNSKRCVGTLYASLIEWKVLKEKIKQL